MIRGAFRVVLVVLVSAAAAPLALGARLIARGPRRPGRRTDALVMHAWARAVCRAVGIRVTVHGERPPRPAFVAPNHVGYVDILVLGALTDGIFVSRADVRDWPLLGPLVRLAGTVFLERERRRDTHRATAVAEALLREGARLLVFLEGRAGSGDHLLPFRSSLLEAAVRTGVPCVPVAVRYTLPFDPGVDVGTVVAWHDETPFLRHAWRLANLRRIAVDVTVLPARSGVDRKALAAALEEDIRAALARVSADRSPER